MTGQTDGMRNRVSLPLSALILALVAALALGTVGTATAGALTTKTVKKIAAKVISKKAPGLSVAHATTADSATTATSAGNSSQLGGAAPSAYQDRIAHELLTGDANINGATVTQINNPTVITVPAGVGFIHVTAVSNFTTGNTNVSVWPSVDGTCVQNGLGYEHRAFGNTTQQTSISVDLVAPVTPGDHSVRMCALTGADTIANRRGVTIETVAGDFNG